MRKWHNFASKEGSKAASNFQEAELREERGSKKRLSGYKSGLRDKAKLTKKEEKVQEGWKALEDK